jgi:hypothetical protein
MGSNWLARTAGLGEAGLGASVPVSRRSVLRAAGVGVALPWLDCLQRSGVRSARAGEPAAPPRRLMVVHLESSLMPQFFFPERGTSGASSPYLDILADHRGLFTSLAGVSHPNLGTGHETTNSFLTGAPNPTAKNFRNSQSIDQYAAEQIGHETRFPSLTLGVRHHGPMTDILSVSKAGVPIISETSPRQLYRKLFVAGTPQEKAESLRRLDAGRSVLDLVLDQAGKVHRKGSQRDRDRIDQYFSSVRELEERLARAREWEDRPKPAVEYAEPADIEDRNKLVERSKLMFDIMRLAAQTDSTRFMTCYVSTFHIVPMVPGVRNETHGLTHHGNEPEKIAELRKIEEAQITAFEHLLRSLRDVDEGHGTLLDNTMVLFGSGLGSANAHSSTNLPLVLAGGGFRHGGHLEFDEQRNEPLCNLFVTMLQRLGIETDAFSTSTGTLRGLDVA